MPMRDCKARRSAKPPIRSLRHWQTATALGLIAGAILLGGCKRREVVRPTPQMDTETRRFWVRVLLFASITECAVGAPSEMYVSRFTPNPVDQAPPRASAVANPLRVTIANGQLHFGADSQASADAVISTGDPHILTLNNNGYRGQLRVIVNPDGRTFRVINLVPLEPYLAGVVGAEMPSYWEPEALKAQAIAARTYCLYTKDRFGAHRNWDVKSTQASQVYRGLRSESAPVWRAVTSTHGMVLVSPAASGGLFPTYFSSVCGGQTENSRNVFGESFEPLQSVPCPYCKGVARLGLFFWPMAQFDRQTVTRRLRARYASLEALGDITDIIVANKSDYGQFARVTRIKLVGSTGKTDVLRGEDLRLALDPSGRKIQSAICRIAPWGDGWAFLSGRGWGHGVGLCQHGAEGMARLGKSSEEILRHYYAGAEIANIY
jgi:stage II sporulation protein D